VANQPDMIRGIRNAIILIEIVNAFDPALLEGLEKAVPEGLAEAPETKAGKALANHPKAAKSGKPSCSGADSHYSSISR
jgi:hypothetical protein